MDPAYAMVQHAWRWYGDRWKMVFCISAVASAPLLVKEFYSTTIHLIGGGGVLVSPNWVSDYLRALSWLLMLFAALWSVWGTVALYLYILRRGKLPSFWRVYTASGAFFFRYLWAGILTSLVIFGGTLLFVLPGIYLAVIFSFVPLIVVAEHADIRTAFRRSYHLVRGYWWPVVGRVLLMALSVAGAGVILGVSGIFVLFFLHLLIPIPTLYLSDIWSVFMNAVLMPPTVILTALLYLNLKKLHAEKL